eukprot:3814322-Alexandrium_andersonii.AAC.1
MHPSSSPQTALKQPSSSPQKAFKQPSSNSHVRGCARGASWMVGVQEERVGWWDEGGRGGHKASGQARATDGERP